MLRFKYKGIVPPGSRYLYAINEHQFSHPERAGLLRQIVTYVVQNGLTMPDDLEAAVEDYTCRQIPAGFCEGDDDGRPRSLALTMADIRGRTVRLITGESLADRGMATERAVVCAKCPNNDRTACPTCTGLVAWGVRLVRGQELPGYSDVLGVCTVDGCLMVAGVFAKSTVRPDQAPSNCWRGHI
jgi:hypothetical protein